MAIDHTLLRMFMKMQERYRLSGDIVTIGVQDVMFNHQSGAEFFQDEGYKYTPIDEKERTYRTSKAQAVYEGIFNVKNPMHMHDLFRMLGFKNASSLDAFDADSPTILHDMNKPIPDQYTLSSALTGGEIFTWIYHVTGKNEYREIAYHALKWVLSTMAVTGITLETTLSYSVSAQCNSLW